MSYLDPGELSPTEMYGRERIPARLIHETVDLDLMESEDFGDEAGTVTPLIVHAPDCTCQGYGICLVCAIEDDAAFAVFCQRTGMNPDHRGKAA